MLITNDETRNLPYWLCNKKIAWKKQSCFESSRTISIVVLKWPQNQFLWLRRDLLTCEYASTSLLWRRFGAPVHAAIPKNNSTSGAISQQANSNRELGHLQRNPDFHNRVKVCPTIAEIVARTKGLLFAIFSRNHSLGEEQIPHQNNNWIINAWWKGWISAYLTSHFLLHHSHSFPWNFLHHLPSPGRSNLEILTSPFQIMNSPSCASPSFTMCTPFPTYIQWQNSSSAGTAAKDSLNLHGCYSG